MSREEDYPENDDDDDDDYYEDYEEEDREEEVLASSDGDDEEEKQQQEEILASSDEDEDEDDDDEEEEKQEEQQQEEERSSDAVIPTSASPYMVMHRGIDETEQTFYSISKGSYFDTSVPEMYGSICCASSNGWLVMLDSSSDSSNRFCFLLNSVSLEDIIDLPSIKTSYKFDDCILTSSPPDCVVMFLSEDENSCIFCRPNDQRWTRKILGRKPERGGSRSYFQVMIGAVSCEGKIYINYGHGQGMKILDYKDEDSRIIGNRFTVEKIKFKKGLTYSFGSFMTESPTCLYLVESCAEVFLVVRIYIGSSNLNTYSFSVYKLMTSSSMGGRRRIAWKKVETLGNDRVFLVAPSGSLSVSASKAGLKENYIYFSHRYDPRYVYRFSMDTGSIYKTPSFSHVIDVNPICGYPYWMVSNSIL